MTDSIAAITVETDPQLAAEDPPDAAQRCQVPQDLPVLIGDMALWWLRNRLAYDHQRAETAIMPSAASVQPVRLPSVRLRSGVAGLG